MTVAASIDSLPYHDIEPTEAERDAADALIACELGSHTGRHPSIPPLRASRLSDALEAELVRIGRGEKSAGIDLSRYEDIAAPVLDPSATPDTVRDAWRDALARNVVAREAMRGRLDDLALLDRYGGNVRAVAAEAGEQRLRAAEQLLRGTRRETELLNGKRRREQETTGVELETLSKRWRQLVSDNIEIAAANAVLEREVASLQ